MNFLGASVEKPRRLELVFVFVICIFVHCILAQFSYAFITELAFVCPIVIWPSCVSHRPGHAFKLRHMFGIGCSFFLQDCY